jgi:hypothetical protein
MSSGLMLVAWVYMHYPSWLVWGRATSPVQADRSSATACGHSNSGLAIVMIALVSLSLSFAAQAQSKTAPVAKPAAKPTTSNADEQLYQNVTFGFRYQIPFGWINRTQEMGSQKTAAQDQHIDDASKSKLLLAVFERPPEATGDTINSAVVIASESAASYPGLKKAEDYLGPLTELATANGFQAGGEPYALEVESRHLLRTDFIKPLGADHKATNKNANDDTNDKVNDQLTMRQCTLVLLTKGQIVSFTFIAGSEDELDDLMDALHFTVAKPSAR